MSPPKKETFCGDCLKRLTSDCPRCEYRDHELNLAACLPTDKVCEKFSRREGDASDGSDAISASSLEADTDKKLSQADRLVKFCLEEALNTFYDQTKTPYVRVRRENALVTIPIRSKVFRAWLSNLMWKNEEKNPGTEAVYGALRVLEGMALFDGREYHLYNRVAPAEDGVWIDMCDDRWRAIKVTANGWHIEEEPPILFRRYSHQRPLVEPKKGGDPFLFLDFVNIPVEDKNTRLVVLVVGISFLIPDIPHVILVLYGIQGSGKTLFFKLLRNLIDPSAIGVLTVPKNERERVQQLDHHWCSFFDNITRFPPWMSDTMCRASTGGGFTKRELYTDDDDIIYDFRRCVGLNGINIAAQRGDLLDRSVLVGLKNIPEDKRETEEDLLARFEEAKPYILGGFLDTLVRAMQVYPSVNSQRLFRMADFTRWGCALAMALKYTEEEFLEAYGQKVRDQIKEVAHASIVATVLIDYMEGLEKWEGTPSELYKFLQAHAKQMGVSTRQKAWPKAPHVLVRQLNELAPSLKALGLEVVSSRTGKARKILINCVKVRGRNKENSVSSVTSVTGTGSDKLTKEEGVEPTTCWICSKLLPENLANTTVEDGRFAHVSCALDYKKGRRR